MLCFAKFVVAVARQAFSRLRGRKSARSVGRKLLGELINREVIDIFEFHICLHFLMFHTYKINNPAPISNTLRATKIPPLVERVVKSVENPEKFAKFVKNKQS